MTERGISRVTVNQSISDLIILENSTWKINSNFIEISFE